MTWTRLSIPALVRLETNKDLEKQTDFIVQHVTEAPNCTQNHHMKDSQTNGRLDKVIAFKDTFSSYSENTNGAPVTENTLIRYKRQQSFFPDIKTISPNTGIPTTNLMVKKYNGHSPETLETSGNLFTNSITQGKKIAEKFAEIPGLAKY